jgi:hypothetical protein
VEASDANHRIETLQSLAKRLKKRLKPIQLWDSNVCDSTIRDSIVHIRISGYPFSHELRFQHQERRVTLLGNSEYLCIRLDSRRDFPILCSINQANKVIFMKAAHLHVGDDERFPVFLQTRDIASDTLVTLLRSSVLLNAVEQLLHDRSESLHIFQRGIALYSKVWAMDELNRAIETLSVLMNTCEALGAPEVSHFSDLPAKFHDLIPLIERWAESDDAARDAMLDEVSDLELQNLVKIIDPRFEQINEYLNSFVDALPDSATALGALAECATEAQLRLSQRK